MADSSKMRFDGKVVLITGSGAGLGREYALDFARRGASVVVNDLGTTRDGRSQPRSKAADAVVKEIRSYGGTAVANYDSVEFGDKVVQTALDNFGKIDIVINNAGILRDRSFARMSEQDWDIIHKVHLKGAFSVTRAAWEHMKKQGYGRVIMTSSPSGLYGNFGQTNYSAAKLGLVGFANTLSLEGKKYGILVNTIAPTALTRMTEDLMGEDAHKTLKPAYIMPLVVYLCHDSNQTTGGVFELSGGHICKLRWQRTGGAAIREPGREMTAEDVRDNWTKITDWTNNPHHMESIMDANMYAAGQIQRMESGDNDLSSDHPIQPKLAKKYQFPDITTVHDEYKCILYALGVGMSTKDEDHLKFLFEGNDDFSVLPSYAVIPAFEALGGLVNAEGLNIDPTKILHGEQYLELYKPIPRSGKLTSKARIVDVLDKGSGCAIIQNVDTYDESGEKVFMNQFVTFVVGYGGFKGQRTSDQLKAHVAVPKRAPDHCSEEKTNQDQAALYRLSGDFNPLHIEPSFAAMGGFGQPILHGLCTLGHATRHVMKKFAGNDPKRVRAIKVRFAAPVTPGHRLRTEMWRSTGGRVHFQTVNVDTGKTCLAGGYMDLNSPSSGDAESSAVEEVALASDSLFEAVKAQLSAEIVRKVKATYRWNITRDGKTAKSWLMDLKSGEGAVTCSDDVTKAACTITISDDDAVKIFGGKLNPQQAFMSGKMKVSGNLMLAQKLEVLFKAAQAKL